MIRPTLDNPANAATAGDMGALRPSRAQRNDIAFGWPLLEQLVELGVSQAIAVRERDVICVEAAETTEAMIQRTGSLCRARGWTLLMTGKAGGRTSGLPTISVDTIQQLAAAGAGCAALGTGRVIPIDKPALLLAAHRARIALVGIG